MMEPDSRDNIGPASGTPTPTAAQQLAAHHNDKHHDHDHGDHDHEHGDQHDLPDGRAWPNLLERGCHDFSDLVLSKLFLI